MELGPFDFDKQPTTGSLWMSEGVTSFYSGLLMTRSGLQTPDEYLASLSSLIGRTCRMLPGGCCSRSSSRRSRSGTTAIPGSNPNATTVSYYNKGNVLGLLLDAKIRRMTDGRRSFDDVMRLAYQRYGGERGFTADELRMIAETVAGGDLRAVVRKTVSSTEELDYGDLLECTASGSWSRQAERQATGNSRCVPIRRSANGEAFRAGWGHRVGSRGRLSAIAFARTTRRFFARAVGRAQRAERQQLEIG